jgi:hypothetical protein
MRQRALKLTAPVPPPPREDEEQIALFQWAALNEKRVPELRLMFHIANGGHRYLNMARKLKLMGVKPGVPDILLPVRRWGKAGLWLEMKRQDSGRLSGEQAEFIAALQAEGYVVHVCRSSAEAIAAIEEYLSGVNH